MTPPTDPKTPAPDTPPNPDEAHLDHPIAEPVASPAPPIDGTKPIAEGKDAVEKFLVTHDTGGGD